MKTKQCGECLKDFPSLWKAKRKLPDGTIEHGLCKECATKPKVGDLLKPKGQGNFKPTHRIISIKPISPISNKRKEALKRYRRLRDKHFLEHPVCEYPNCSSTDITLHHQRGRCGAFLTDKRYFKSLCMKHHRWVEENVNEAIKLGLSIKRLDKHK